MPLLALGPTPLIFTLRQVRVMLLISPGSPVCPLGVLVSAAGVGAVAAAGDGVDLGLLRGVTGVVGVLAAAPSCNAISWLKLAPMNTGPAEVSGASFSIQMPVSAFNTSFWLCSTNSSIC